MVSIGPDVSVDFLHDNRVFCDSNIPTVNKEKRTICRIVLFFTDYPLVVQQANHGFI